MIEMNADYAARFYSLLEADTRDPDYFSLEPNLFNTIFPGLEYVRIIDGISVIFLKEEAKKYLKNIYGIHLLKEITCQESSPLSTP